MRNKIVAVAVVASLGCIATSAFARPADPRVQASLAQGRKHVNSELLVQFKAGASESERARALSRVNANALEQVRAAFARNAGGNEESSLHLVDLPNGRGLLEAIDALQSDDAVEFAEPNWIYTKQVTVGDTYVANGTLWGMYGAATSPANTFGSGAVAAWGKGQVCSSSVYVGIIDEGYMHTHTDLVANRGVNPFEIAGNARDDDGNGLVDDIYGWDFDGNNASVYDGTSDDHGTHVAGTIAGVANGAGVAGVCLQGKLLSAKFLGRRGGTTANAIKAVDYFTNLKNKGLNIVATNNSWGGGGFSQALADAIQRSANADIVFVAAAGNGGSDGVGDNNDAVANYPSNYAASNIIAVAAIDRNGNLAGFSNYGATTVDIGAPGVAIMSTVPGNGGSSSYASYNGTSMATPHVSGAVALYRSLNPGATAAQTKAAILNSATPTTSLQGKTVTGGRLNVSGF